jgi:ketosteroid isomerase-like protein
MDRDAILDTIDRFWDARLAGDKGRLWSFLTPDAIYEMVGASTFAERAVVGPAPFRPAADSLVDDFKFHSVERLTTIVDGNRAAATIAVEVAFRGGPLVKTDACDLWEFDDAGKAKSLRQFVDTALVRRMIEGKA